MKKKIFIFILMSIIYIFASPISDVYAQGWETSNGRWYFKLENGQYAKGGWLLDKNDWYYLDADGAMEKGWIKDKGRWFYLKDSGKMARNVNVDGYYLGADGSVNLDVKNNQVNPDNVYIDVAHIEPYNNIKVNIINKSNNEISYTLSYKIYKLQNDSWVDISKNTNKNIFDIAIMLEPNEVNSQNIDLKNLDEILVPGQKYMISKQIGDKDVAQEFSIQP